MKKNLLIFASAIAALTLTSCFKQDNDPVSGKNSVIKVEGTNFQNLVGNSGTSIKGYTKFDFYLANGTTSDITDTTSFVDSFLITDPLGHTQTYNFDTPDKTKKIQFNVNFEIFGGGSATGVAVPNFSYKKDGTVLLATPLSFTTTDGKTFKTTPQILNLN